MFGLTTTRRLRTELAASKAETDRQRARAERAEGDLSTARYNRGQVLQQNAELEAVNQRLAEQISELADPERECAARLEMRLHRALRACARWMDAAWVETRHADHLQRRLDDAVGLKPVRIEDSSRWQPGYKSPKADAAASCRNEVAP